MLHRHFEVVRDHRLHRIAVHADQIAQETKEGCPVSKALKGNVDLQLEARLV